MRGGSTRTERAYLLRTILREGRKRRGSGAVVEVLDETAVASYLSHPADDMDDASNDDGAGSLGARGSTRTIERPVMITGGGCDDVNYKLNWLNQAVLRYVAAGSGGSETVGLRGGSRGVRRGDAAGGDEGTGEKGW